MADPKTTHSGGSGCQTARRVVGRCSSPEPSAPAPTCSAAGRSLRGDPEKAKRGARPAPTLADFSGSNK